MNPQKILVIDDSRVVVQRLTKELEDAGFEVYSEYDGFKGLETAAVRKPDLIVCDYTLPGMRADLVLQTLKGSQITASIPVVVFSSQADETLIDGVLQEGAAAHVEKSSDYRPLIARIREILGRGSRHPEG